MPALHSIDGGSDEVIEIQHHYVHLNNQHHTNSFVENINAFLHGNTNSNGSHTGSGNALSNSEGPGVVEEDLIIIFALLIPLIFTIGLIFLIAVAVRKMRRSESMQEVVGKNEFRLSAKTKKGLQSSPSNAGGSSSSIMMSPIHHVRTAPSFQTGLSRSSSSSTHSSSSQVPPWFLQSTTYYRSQYQLNKLHAQLSCQGSLQSFNSMQSLNCTVADTAYSSEPHSLSDTEQDNITIKKEKKASTKKKLKKALQIINIPKKIRQHQAEKNRFNIYTIPMETREQLKQIYVY